MTYSSDTSSMPVQYRDGKAHFMDMEFLVDERVLIPRPETELLVEKAADSCRVRSLGKPFILDIGTGSGIIPVGLIKLIGDCKVIGADISEDVLDVTRENLKRFECEDKVELFLSDMFSAFDLKYNEVFDLIVSNPPYVSDKDYEKLDAWVRAEPRRALYAGLDGMDYLNIIADESQKFLKPGGAVVVEVGYDQAEKVKDKFRACGFKDVSGFVDFNGHERVIIGWKNG